MYFSMSLVLRRMFSSTRATCPSCVDTRAGRRPRRPSLSRSASVKAVPLFNAGSCSRSTPCFFMKVTVGTHEIPPFRSVAELLEEVGDHLPPPRPVVGHVVAPDVDPSRDLLLFENPPEFQGVREELVFPIPLAHADHQAALPVPVQVPRVIEAGKIGDRRVEIDPVVHVEIGRAHV